MLLSAFRDAPALGTYVLDEQDRLRKHMTVFVDNQMIADRDVDLIYGRMPGGLGTFRAKSRAAYHSAGMAAPVFWNAGPPGWPARAGAPTARAYACTFLREKRPIILLLHETAGLENELRAFYSALKAGCKG